MHLQEIGIKAVVETHHEFNPIPVNHLGNFPDLFDGLIRSLYLLEELSLHDRPATGFASSFGSGLRPRITPNRS